MDYVLNNCIYEKKGSTYDEYSLRISWSNQGDISDFTTALSF
jgi:hypothetical protein